MRLTISLALIAASICMLASAAAAQRHPELVRQYQQGELSAVIEAAQTGIASDSSDLELQLLLGRALADLSRFEEARAPLERVLALDPQRSWPSA